MLLGAKNLECLRNAHIVVAGVGAVGSYAIEALARSGVGALTIVDFDVIKTSNINRQLCALDSTVGERKTDASARRVYDINPECRVEVRNLFLDVSSISEILKSKPDLLLDAIDSLGPKTELLRQAIGAGVATVSSMGAALRRDPGRIRVDSLDKSHGCPLARQLRKRLRRSVGIEGVRCVYSSEKVEKREGRPTEDFQRGRPREILGSTAYIPGMFGLAAAGESIRIILEANS